MLGKQVKTTPLEDKMAGVLEAIRDEVLNSRFTDRYGHRGMIEQALYEYNEKRRNLE